MSVLYILQYFGFNGKKKKSPMGISMQYCNTDGYVLYSNNSDSSCD